MRKVLFAVAALLALTAVLVSCNQTPTKKVVGISQIVTHPALDAVVKGIQDELTDQKVDVSYDLQNANGDLNTAATIANKFKSDKDTLVVGVATPTAQALVKAFGDTKTTPVIYSAITDPVSAGLVDSLTQGGAYVTGYSDLTPVKSQIAFLLSLDKNVKSIGMVYAGGEANAVVLEKLAEQAAADLGLTFVPANVATSAEVKTAAESIVNRVDAFYVSTDNTVVSALPALVSVAKAAKKPIVSADPTSAEKLDVLVALGFNYYNMGRQTGKLVADILSGKTKTADVPTQYMTDPKDLDLLINLDVAKTLGIEIPQSVTDSANYVISGGQETKK